MPTLFNESNVLSSNNSSIENYKGHIEIFDTNDSIWYKPDSLLDWSVSTIVDTEKHYSTNGAKKKSITGNSSVYEFRTFRTADFYESVATPVESKTISFWKSLIHGKPPVLPIITLRGVSESNAASNEFVVDEFTATVENIDELREENSGEEKIIVSGEIISQTSNRRFASAP